MSDSNFLELCRKCAIEFLCLPPITVITIVHSYEYTFLNQRTDFGCMHEVIKIRYYFEKII